MGLAAAVAIAADDRNHCSRGDRRRVFVDLPIRRTFDPTFLNGIANHPVVRPGLFGEGDLDLGGVLSNPMNFGLECDLGGFVLTCSEPGVYEVHSLFLPGHGSGPVRALRAAQEWMFTRTDCWAVQSRVPKSNRPAKGFALAGGLRTLFTRDDAALGPCEYVEISAVDWAMRTPALSAHGKRFHDLLAEAKERTRSVREVHGHDEAHERAVGAAVLMIERGQAPKGVAFYNRWARLAGYAPIALLGTGPVMVDVVDAVVGLGADGMEILVCR